MSLPSGTVTFLFTDIEGSTRLWQEQPRGMTEALPRHDQIVRQAIEAQGGHVFKTVGDAFCAAFASAPSAVAAALQVQISLLEESWPSEMSVRVRIALHTSEAYPQDGDYFGVCLSFVARLLSAGHGGQTLLTQATVSLVQSSLPPSASLINMGVHRLKDLSQPQEIFHLSHPSLPAEFPPLNTLRATQHLPLQPTPLVGREREVREIVEKLSETRLLTLTGGGGTGKTRLALQVAAEVDTDYEGVWFVELAALSDPALVAQVVATTLGIREQPGCTLTQTLASELRDKRALLLLDNCEHLVDACAALGEALLRACVKLKILTTSREAFRIAAETLYIVPPLTSPQSSATAIHLNLTDTLERYASVRLFVERAHAASHTFVYSAGNAQAVAQICRRLEGIPLALELAAARVKVLSTDQIAERLNDDRFRLLTGGSRSATPRQKTLRATIDWSYDLLTEAERRLLQRLSVFAAGCTLEAAEAVCTDEVVEAWEVLDLLEHLVDKSLVQVQEGPLGTRYRLQESLREYGQERLRESPDEVSLYVRHYDYCLALAEEAAMQLVGHAQAEWLARLDEEDDNLRAALGWCRRAAHWEKALCLAGALWRFWAMRGWLTEGREQLGAAVNAAPIVDSRILTRALIGAGMLAYMQCEYTAARPLLERSLALSREIGEKPGIAAALNNLGLVANNLGEYETARRLYDESLALYREAGNTRGAVLALMNLGSVALLLGEHDRARRLYEECLPLSRSAGDLATIAKVLLNIGSVATKQSDLDTALRLFCESLEISRKVGDKSTTAYALIHSANGLRKQGELREAQRLLREGTQLCLELGDRRLIASALEEFGHLALDGQREPEAIRLFGAADALRETICSPLPATEQPQHEAALKPVRSHLGEGAFQAAWEAGHETTWERAVEAALAQ